MQRTNNVQEIERKRQSVLRFVALFCTRFLMCVCISLLLLYFFFTTFYSTASMPHTQKLTIFLVLQFKIIRNGNVFAHIKYTSRKIGLQENI